MITAEEARNKAYAVLQSVTEVQAKSFMTDYIEPAIVKAANNGAFQTEVSLDKFNKSKLIAKIVVKELKAAGFDARHVYCADQRDYENSIRITWDQGVSSEWCQ